VEFARVAAPGQIATAEGLLATIPDDPDILYVVAFGYLQYAFGFVEDELLALPDDAPLVRQDALRGRATLLYDRALGYALRLLATRDRGFPDAFARGGPDLERALARLDRRAAEGLVFAGAALASGINLNRGDPHRTVDLPKAVALLRRVDELAPATEQAIAPMVLGIVYGMPERLGGQPEASRRHFEESIHLTEGKYLMARVMYARYYATSVGDRALFGRTLRDVLAAPPTLAPEWRLSNELAKRRAAVYLAAEARLF
jgi:hypothetical protein